MIDRILNDIDTSRVLQVPFIAAALGIMPFAASLGSDVITRLDLAAYMIGSNSALYFVTFTYSEYLVGLT